MPFKHSITDSRGKVHTRISQERQYFAAAVVHMKPYTLHNGQVMPARSFATWSRNNRLAQSSANRYQHSADFDGCEIVACTPVPTGRHAAREDVVKITHSDGTTTAAIVLRDAGEDE